MDLLSDIFTQDLAMRGLVLGCLVAWAARACRQSPQWSQKILSAGLLLALLLPLTEYLPHWQINQAETTLNATPTGNYSISWMTLISALWMAGGVLFFSRIVYGLHQLRKIRSAAVLMTDAGMIHTLRQVADRLGVDRLPSVYLTKRIQLPLAVGCFGRGSILLPAAAAHWTEEQLRFVLQHETAHLQRRDVFWNLVGHLACALHWWNPFIWRLHRTAVLVREKGCDTTAVAAGIPAVSYARNLLSFAVHQAEPQLLGAGMAGSDLHERIRSLLSNHSPTFRGPSAITRAGLVLCGLVCLTSFTASLRPSKTQQKSVSQMENAALRLDANPFPADIGKPGVTAE